MRLFLVALRLLLFCLLACSSPLLFASKAFDAPRPEVRVHIKEPTTFDTVQTLTGQIICPCPEVQSVPLPPVVDNCLYAAIITMPTPKGGSGTAVPSLVASAAVDSMLKYLGHRETRANRSSLIDKWNYLAGAPPGSYWCMAFQFFGYSAGADGTGRKNPLLKTASVSRQLAYAASYGSGLEVFIPNDYGGTQCIRGDLGCIKSGRDYGEDDIGGLWSGHIYAVQYQESPYVNVTIEGNTNNGGSRNGDRVAARRRDTDHVVAYIRVV